MRILISLYIYLHYYDCKSMKKYRCIRYQKATKNYQNDKLYSFIHTILIVLLEFSACFALYQINNLVIKMVVLYEILVVNK